MSDPAWKCRGCGEIDSLVEISFVPRTMPIEALDLDGNYDVTGSDDDAYWEGETVVGVGCRTDTCPHWQGSVNLTATPTGWTVGTAPQPKDIADLVVNVDGVWVVPTVPLALS